MIQPDVVQQKVSDCLKIAEYVKQLSDKETMDLLFALLAVYIVGQGECDLVEALLNDDLDAFREMCTSNLI